LAEKVKTGGKITLIKMELDSLASVHAGTQDFLRQSKILNVLINNDGVTARLADKQASKQNTPLLA
jgi:hypothetical protein